MKTNPQKQATVSAFNTALLEAAVGPIEQNPAILGILYLVADMCDCIANGQDMYMIISATRDRTAFSLNVKGAGAPGAIYGVDLGALGEQAINLL